MVGSPYKPYARKCSICKQYENPKGGRIEKTNTGDRFICPNCVKTSVEHDNKVGYNTESTTGQTTNTKVIKCIKLH